MCPYVRLHVCVCVYVRRCVPGEPIDLMPLSFAPSQPNKELFFVLVNPVFEAPTAEMRAVLPKEVPLKSMINNCTQGGALVSVCVCVCVCVCL